MILVRIQRICEDCRTVGQYWVDYRYLLTRPPKDWEIHGAKIFAEFESDRFCSDCRKKGVAENGN